MYQCKLMVVGSSPTTLSKVTKILLVKGHACKGKELFHVKIKDSTCAVFTVGQFN